MRSLNGLEFGHDIDFFAWISVWMIDFCCKRSISMPASSIPQKRLPSVLKAFLISSSEAVGGTSRSV